MWLESSEVMLGFDKFWRIHSGILQVNNIQISIWCLCSNDMWRILNTSLQVCLSVQVLHGKAKVRGEGGDPRVFLLPVVLLLSWLQGPLEEGAAVCGQVKVRLHISTHRTAVCGQVKVRLHLSTHRPAVCGQVKVRLHLSTHRVGPGQSETYFQKQGHET